jgi:DNA-3-methyladenine glycosylase I
MATCNWGMTSAINQKYHDEEWGIPLHNDQKQFEFLMMEVMQCGLSWDIVIKKREIFRACFDGFDFNKIAAYTEQDIERIMATDGMIKSRRKIEAVIHNAGCFQKIRAEFGTFDKYLWSWSSGQTIVYDKHGDGEIPVSNGLSDRISADLKRRGFKFLGTVTVYSHLQACGMINDHGSDCPRYKYILENYPCVFKRKYKEK